MQAQAEVAVTEGAPRLEQVGAAPPPLLPAAAAAASSSPRQHPSNCSSLPPPLQKAPVMVERKHKEVDKRSLTWSQICKSLAAGGVAGAV